MFHQVFGKIYCVILFSGIFAACSAQKPVRYIQLDDEHVVILLDSTQASKTILYDPMDHFFDKVTAVEMSIQMKKPLDSGTDRQVLLTAYEKFLQTDVADFSAKESKLVAKSVKSMFPVCKSYASDIFPDTLILIKTKAKHYGPGVYYTRANCIVIPADALDAYEEEAFTSTMYHELSHVYNRLNPEKRQKLYRLIGFESIGYDKLIIPPVLASRLLHNPDGVDFAQKITIKTSDSTTIQAIPVIYANADGYQQYKPFFFNYLEFNLYAVEPTPDGNWKVLTKPDGLNSILNLRRLPDFYRQIRDNTGYIIHPDEILADNFSFIMAAHAGYRTTDNFSMEGQALLKDIEQVLRETKR
jgi:hypothetical protein